MIPPQIYAALALLIAGFAAGWTVCDWKNDAAELAIQKAGERASQAASEAVAKIKVENKTIYQQATTKVIERPVYKECQHDSDMMDQINAALTWRQK